MDVQAAKAAIATVIRAWPELGYLGLRHPGKFEIHRKQLEGEHAAEEFIRAVTWLEKVPKRKTFNPYNSSYGIKEAAEKWTGDYISNGVFIAAAIHAGFRVAQIPGTPNAEIGIATSAKWPKPAA
ncbi:hypothetical protein [Methyloceanibacter sp.]|uniref:hypothetical protein n=1 Tax=Methyloceanibacter sp. TaxID=1965321 RepID=UPI003D6D2DA7